MTDQTARHLNARDLDALVATIKAGSLINAAQQLCISQSAISRSIANVEHALGAILLEQTPRGIEPTLQGRALIEIHNVHRRSRQTERGAKTGPTQEDGERPSLGRREVIQMAATITLTYPFSADDTALLNKLLDTPGATLSPSPARENYFPADPAKAPFPSPENAQQMVFNGVIGGEPYLRDQAGATHQIRMLNGAPAYYKMDQAFPVYQGEAVGQILVRQGEVYMQITSGIWKHVEPNGSIYNKSLPPPWATTGVDGGTGLPALPPMPKPSAIGPGSSGKVIQVGPSRVLKTLSGAIPTATAGDKIQLDPGTYTDTPPAWSIPLLIDLGGATFNAAGKTATLARGMGLLCPAADSIIQNGTITNVAMDQGQGQLTSAIRPDAGCGYLKINNMTLTNNQCGVGHGGFPSVIAISDSNISGNGLKANTGSLTHNLYVGSECRRLTLTNVISNGTNEGHAIKYRGPELIVNGGTFASAPGKPFDMPNGATVPFKITGATILKGASDPDHGILACGEENTENGLAGGMISGGSIQANCDNPTISGPSGTITLSGVTLRGNKIAASGGVVLVGV
jgi:regulatory helix-turn-helix LysR family protein